MTNTLSCFYSVDLPYQLLDQVLFDLISIDYFFCCWCLYYILVYILSDTFVQGKKHRYINGLINSLQFCGSSLFWTGIRILIQEVRNAGSLDPQNWFLMHSLICDQKTGSSSIEWLLYGQLILVLDASLSVSRCITVRESLGRQS